MWSPTGLIPWFSKTEGNTYATLLHHPLLFAEIQRSAQEVARRISGIVVGESTQKVNIPSTHHNPYLSHYIICHLPLFFLSPTSPLLFYSPSLSLSSLSIYLFFPACFLFASVLVCLLFVMSEIGEIIADMSDNNIMENSEAPAEESPTYHTKRFRIGSGNIIGK